MSTHQSPCFRCNTTLTLPDGPVGRRESCAQCGADVRVCLNCQNYDPKAYNDCREPQAERVLDKTAANFCDHFRLGGRGVVSAQTTRDDVFKQLDNLFKK